MIEVAGWKMTREHSEIASNWRERSFTCNLWVDHPGQVWVDYVHDVDELLVVLEGELEIIMEGRTINPKIGEEVIIPARVEHTVKNVGTTENRWLYGYRTIN